MNDSMTNSVWIEANPTRRYRIRRRSEADDQGLTAVTIVEIGAGRRWWSEQNIKIRNELPDTDEAAALALQEHELIFKARLGKFYGQPMSDRAILDKLRQEAAKHA